MPSSNTTRKGRRGGPYSPVSSNSEDDPIKGVMGDWDEYEQFYTGNAKKSLLWDLMPTCCTRAISKMKKAHAPDCKVCVGQGYSGKVYKSTIGGKSAIVKVSDAKKSPSIARFSMMEASILRVLTDKFKKDPIAPRFYAYGIDHANGYHVLIMEYINSEALDNYLKGGIHTDAHLDKIQRDLTKLMDKFHGAGFVHFDLKPGNILVEKDEYDMYKGMRLIDFGSTQQIGRIYTHVAQTPGYSVIFDAASGRKGAIDFVRTMFTPNKYLADHGHDTNIVSDLKRRIQEGTLRVEPEFNDYSVMEIEVRNLKRGGGGGTRRKGRKGGRGNRP